MSEWIKMNEWNLHLISEVRKSKITKMKSENRIKRIKFEWKYKIKFDVA